MLCEASRLSKQSSGVPGAKGGLIHSVPGGERNCDVSCGLGSGRTCHFEVSALRTYFFVRGSFFN